MKHTVLNPIIPEDPLKTPEAIHTSSRRTQIIRKVSLVIIVVILFSFTVCGIALAAAYYPAQIPFFPTQYRVALNQLLLKTTLPKNPEQVTLAILENLPFVKRFNQKFFVKSDDFTFETNEQEQNASVAFRSDGGTDLSNIASPSMSQNLSLIIKTDLAEYELLIDYKLINGNLYMRINYISPTVINTSSTSTLVGKWVLVPLRGFNIFPELKTPSDKELISVLLDNNYLSLLSPVQKEYIGGAETYLLTIDKSYKQISPLVNDLVRLLFPSLDDTLPILFTSHIEHVTGNFWVSTQSANPRRISLQLLITPPESITVPESYDLLGLGLKTITFPGKTPFNVTLGWEASGINQPQGIKEPQDAIPFDKFIELLRVVQKESESTQKAVADFRTLANATTTYRLNNEAYPETIDQLVERNYLNILPTSPGGGKYIYVANSGSHVFIAPENLAGLTNPAYYLLYELESGELQKINQSTFDAYTNGSD